MGQRHGVFLAAILAQLAAFLSLDGDLHAQIRFDVALIVPESDPICPALDNYRNQIEKRYDATAKRPAFDKWVEIRSPEVVQLFPTLRFTAISWSERPRPKMDHRFDSFAFGLQTTVGVDATKRSIEVELPGFGNYEEFGNFLAKNRVRICDAADAKTVWDAFCALHFKHCKDQKAVRISDSIWHLGNTTSNGYHYYYEVVLDEHQTVRSARSRSSQVQTSASGARDHVAPPGSKH